MDLELTPQEYEALAKRMEEIASELRISPEEYARSVYPPLPIGPQSH